MKVDQTSFAESLKLLNRGATVPGEAQPQASPSNGVSFGDFLVKQIEEVNTVTLNADRKIEEAIAGREVHPHTTMIALQQADISFRLVMAIKDAVTQAYQEMIKTQI